ncbi:hypothetical protein LK231_0633 [Lactococcus lactis subsp. lactis]|nr:hypothetical protein LK231_0633 [Lactococcus lactis subsp. lactis]
MIVIKIIMGENDYILVRDAYQMMIPLNFYLILKEEEKK